MWENNQILVNTFCSEFKQFYDKMIMESKQVPILFCWFKENQIKKWNNYDNNSDNKLVK